MKEQEEFLAKSFLSNSKMNRTMPLKEFLEEARSLSIYPEREIFSMIWDSDKGLSPPKSDKKMDEKEKKYIQILPIQEEDDQSYIFGLFDSGNTEELGKCDESTLLLHLNAYYNSAVPITSFLKLI